MFKNNIKALEKINKNLSKKINKISLNKASQNLGALKNQYGEYILTSGDRYIDDTPSPLEAAKKIYESQIKSATSRHDFIVIFGLGLGNLLDYIHQKSISSLILYEPDLNILRFTFEYVDLTKYFTDRRLYITDNINDCTKYIEERYLLDDKIEFVFLKNYLMLHSSEFTLLTERIYETCQNKIVDLNTIKKLSKDWVINTLHNVTDKAKNYPVNLLENKFKNKTALVLGAGPSLKDNIEKIKKNRDKFIIFAVHRTLEILKNNDIFPDFCVVIDAKWLKDSLKTDNEYLKSINVIEDIKSDYYLRLKTFKHYFIYYSQNNTFSNKLQMKLPTKLKCLETGGTSTICAYRCAKLMGFKNIIFAGVDLAFKDDTAYCTGQIAVANDGKSIKLHNNIIPLATVKSITGKYVKTRADYAEFIKQFEIIFAKDKTSNLYNLSTFGAFINGMQYKSLEEILSDETVSSSQIIEETIKSSSSFEEKIHTTSLDILKEEQQKIRPVINSVQEWFEMYKDHPSFFEYATPIITSITSTMILQDIIQIEIIQFSKLVLSKDNKIKKELIVNMFNTILNYSKNLDNLINIENKK